VARGCSSVSARTEPSGPGSHNRTTQLHPAVARPIAVTLAVHPVSCPVPAVGPTPISPVHTASTVRSVTADTRQEHSPSIA
jgi:hypothetical protein